MLVIAMQHRLSELQNLPTNRRRGSESGELLSARFITTPSKGLTISDPLFVQLIKSQSLPDGLHLRYLMKLCQIVYDRQFLFAELSAATELIIEPLHLRRGAHAIRLAGRKSGDFDHLSVSIP